MVSSEPTDRQQPSGSPANATPPVFDVEAPGGMETAPIHFRCMYERKMTNKTIASQRGDHYKPPVSQILSKVASDLSGRPCFISAKVQLLCVIADEGMWCSVVRDDQASGRPGVSGSAILPMQPEMTSRQVAVRARVSSLLVVGIPSLCPHRSRDPA
jgi:hypothetical protein